MTASTPDLPHRSDPRGPRTPAAAGVAAPARPGWTEVVVGVAVFLGFAFGGLPLIKAIGLDPMVYGLITVAWSGVAGIAGVAVASALRLRSPVPFGLGRTPGSWLAIGLGGGLIAFVVARVATLIASGVVGPTANVQEVYTDTGANGPVSLVLTLLLIGVLTPIGEEALFRGVVANALLRHGRAAGILGSAVVFAAVHGPNLAVVPALVVGLINAELFRRSRSIWPGVVVHAVNNLLGIGLGVLVGVPG